MKVSISQSWTKSIRIMLSLRLELYRCEVVFQHMMTQLAKLVANNWITITMTQQHRCWIRRHFGSWKWCVQWQPARESNDAAKPLWKSQCRVEGECTALRETAKNDAFSWNAGLDLILFDMKRRKITRYYRSFTMTLRFQETYIDHSVHFGRCRLDARLIFRPIELKTKDVEPRGHLKAHIEWNGNRICCWAIVRHKRWPMKIRIEVLY